MVTNTDFRSAEKSKHLSDMYDVEDAAPSWDVKLVDLNSSEPKHVEILLVSPWLRLPAEHVVVTGESGAPKSSEDYGYED